MQRYRDNNWNPKNFVVTQCLVAGGATILISQGSNSQIDLKAEGDVKAANLNLANLTLKLGITKKSNIAVEFTGKKNFTPLFEAWGLKKRLFGDPQVEPHTDSDFEPRVEDKPTIEFDKVDYDDPPS